MNFEVSLVSLPPSGIQLHLLYNFKNFKPFYLLQDSSNIGAYLVNKFFS